MSRHSTADEPVGRHRDVHATPLGRRAARERRRDREIPDWWPRRLRWLWLWVLRPVGWVIGRVADGI